MKNVPSYEVLDVKELKVAKYKFGRTIDEDELGHVEDVTGAGCYVFGMRPKNGTIMPWYAGLATKGFYEAVTNDKLKKYNLALAKSAGRPVLFLLKQNNKSKFNKKSMTRLEEFLIRYGYEKNPDFLNKRKIPKADFSIKGVFPAKPGEAKAKSATRFRKMMDI